MASTIKTEFGNLRQQNGRNNSLLNPISLPAWKQVGFDPWFLTAIESDVLMGRRGVLGWDSFRANRGLLIQNRPPTATGFWEMLDNSFEKSPWKTVGYLVAGGLILAGGIALSLGTLGLGAMGLGSLVLGGMVSGFGASFGITGALTGDFGKAMTAGAIGAAAGAVGGAATFGAMGLAMAGGMSTAMAFGVGSVAGGAAGGFAGGTLSGLADGKGWGDSLRQGVEEAGSCGIK